MKHSWRKRALHAFLLPDSKAINSGVRVCLHEKDREAIVSMSHFRAEEVGPWEEL